jgi:mRNA interferase HigB
MHAAPDLSPNEPQPRQPGVGRLGDRAGRIELEQRFRAGLLVREPTPARVAAAGRAVAMGALAGERSLPMSRRLVPTLGTCYMLSMRAIARNVLVTFWERHPETKEPLERWYRLAKAAQWTSTNDIQMSVPKAKVLNRERVRFEVAGGNYRLVVAFDFRRQIAFVKFIGTHAEYDPVDALTISQF